MFLFIPIGITIRLLLVVVILNAQLSLVEHNVKVRELFGIVLLWEVAFLIFLVIITGLVFTHTFTSFEELSGYSLFHLIPNQTREALPGWLQIQKRIVNPVDTLYWVVLSGLFVQYFAWNYLRGVPVRIKNLRASVGFWDRFTH
jgi:hypothetical protein